MYMGSSPKQQQWGGKLITLGHVQLYTISIRLHMLESTPLLQKNGSLDLKELFHLFCDATKTDLFQFLISCDKDDVRQVVHAPSYK